VKEKEVPSRTASDPVNSNSSRFNPLLFLYKVTSNFSPQQLEQGISEFDHFQKEPKVADLDHNERARAFTDKKRWTGDEIEDFRIGSAIFSGWLVSAFGREALRNFVASRDKKGNRVYKYQCRKCGSRVGTSGYSLHFRGQSMETKGPQSQIRITRHLSQYQYDRLEIDEGLSVLRGKEIKKCPDCNQFVEFKKVKRRKQPWVTLKHIRKMDRIQERTPHGIPVIPEELREYDKAWDDWNRKPVEEWKQMNTNRFPDGAEVDAWLKRSKPYLENVYRTFPAEIRLCARFDCLNPLPSGSRKDRLYCSDRCQSIQKSRRARRK
jgi:hypothetical protein